MTITSRSTLEQAIIAWMQFVLNPTGTLAANKIPIIMGNDKGPRPARTYITLMIIANPQRGSVYKSDVVLTTVGDVTTGTQTLIWQYEATLSIQGYGLGIEDKLELLRQSPAYLTVKEKIDSLGFGIRKMGDITDISEVLDEQNENRYLLECFIGYRITGKDYPGWIESFEYSGDYDPAT